MENFNHQEYRDNLAEKLRATGDHKERKKILEKEEKTSQYYRAERGHKQENFSKTQEYHDYIEHINSLPNALEKMIFVSEDYFETRLDTDDRYEYGLFNKSSIFYNKECYDSIVEELKLTITTPEQLDEFLSKLMTRMHSYYSNKGLLEKHKVDALDGHVFMKIITRPILDGFTYEHPEDDLEWWYTLGRHFAFATDVMLTVISIYREHQENPLSIKFKEYLESNGYGFLLEFR